MTLCHHAVPQQHQPDNSSVAESFARRQTAPAGRLRQRIVVSVTATCARRSRSSHQKQSAIKLANLTSLQNRHEHMTTQKKTTYAHSAALTANSSNRNDGAKTYSNAHSAPYVIIRVPNCAQLRSDQVMNGRLVSRNESGGGRQTISLQQTTRKIEITHTFDDPNNRRATCIVLESDGGVNTIETVVVA